MHEIVHCVFNSSNSSQSSSFSIWFL